MSKKLTAIGLMSGTSLDGVDAALIYTDGKSLENPHIFVSRSYDKSLRADLRSLLLSKDVDLARKLEGDITRFHGEIVTQLLAEHDLQAADIDVIGFHGQTIDHRPDDGFTWQIGDGALLANLTGIDVVNDFRKEDVELGGQGAPLVPVYHSAIAADLPKPVAILNIGGVANVTYIDDENLIAFDTGTGNAMINDVVFAATGAEFDEGGKLAKKGTIDEIVLAKLMDNDYFDKKPPKSLDRDDFCLGLAPHPNPLPEREGTRGSDSDEEGTWTGERYLDGKLNPFSPREKVRMRSNDISTEEAAATLVAFVAKSVARAQEFFPREVANWYICGGGRHNDAIMGALKAELSGEVHKIEEIGANGDALEAEAFAFLAVRALKKLPLTFASTTGIKQISAIGGVFYPA